MESISIDSSLSWSHLDETKSEIYNKKKLLKNRNPSTMRSNERIDFIQHSDKQRQTWKKYAHRTKRMVFKMWFDLKHSLVYKEVVKLCYCWSTKYHFSHLQYTLEMPMPMISLNQEIFSVQRNATIANVLVNSHLSML